MNWKYEAIEKLKHYQAKKNALTALPEEIQRLEQKGTSIRSGTGDGQCVRGGGSGREDMLLNSIVAKEEARANLKDTVRWLNFVDSGLAVLSEEERNILDMLYIHPARGNVDRLCQLLGCEKTSVYRKRDKALVHFTLALYGRCDS